MKLFMLLKYFNKNSNERKEIEEIFKSLPENDIIVKEILDKLDNKKTKVILDKDIKNNYYFYLNDTIYLSDKEKSKNTYARVSVDTHECIHSIQSKTLQKINFIVSNVELVAFVLLIALKLFKIDNININIYLIIIVLSIIPRIILEIDAVFRTLKISKMYLNEKISKEKLKIVESVYNFQSKALLPLFLISLIFWKIIRALIVVCLFI